MWKVQRETLLRTKKYKQTLFYCQEYLLRFWYKKKALHVFSSASCHSRVLLLLISPFLVVRLDFFW